MSNQMTAQKPKFSVAIGTPTYQKLISQTLGDKKKAERYTAAIMSAVATNPQLQQCEAKTILSSSLLAESLGLAHSPQLGQYYMIPFKVKAKNGIPEHYDATFVLGYKGYIQLAVRSGQYRRINAMEIKQGELAYYNPFDDEIELNPIQDFDEREKAETVGYYAMFEYLNGFKKVLYWSKKQMLQHADRYSQAFSIEATTIKTQYGEKRKVSYADYLSGNYNEKDEWMYSSFWYKDFDGMAKKTMLRQIISKWGVMSTEMVRAFDNDNAVINISENGGEFVPTSADDESDIPEDFPTEQPPENEEVNIDDL